MVEKIDRLSATQNEMGWEKSEDKIRSRILSAYSVHPYILGEPVGVGGYAQVAGIERVFCNKVNTYLSMLGNVLTNKFANAVQDDKLLVWWDKCEPLDPNIRNKLFEIARKNGDVTRDEFRSEMGLPPMKEESNRSRLVGDPVAYSSTMNTLGKQGLLSPDGVAQLLILFLGITEEEAARIAGGGTLSNGDASREMLEELHTTVLAMKEPLQISVDHLNVAKMSDNILHTVS